MTLLTSLSQPGELILDGATGTKLNCRGVDTGLPLWSANALLTGHDSNILQQVHEDYLRAGADIITTNIFCAHRRALAPSGNADRALELTRRSVNIARNGSKKAGGTTYVFHFKRLYYRQAPRAIIQIRRANCNNA